MKINTALTEIILTMGLLLPAQSGAAATFYVNAKNAFPAAPYATWPTAAVQIQDALDVASNGDEIVVTNGVYASGGSFLYDNTSNRVAADFSVTIQSVNGPQATFIQGYQVPGSTNGAAAIRGVYLADGAVLSGFTVTNGATATGDAGGGIYCSSTAGIITNCIIVGNSADSNGGGVELGTLENCTLRANTATDGGAVSDGILTNCTLTGNAAAEGGAAYYAVLQNCTLTGNSAVLGGGASGSILSLCTLSGNSATDGGGTYFSTNNDCILSGNSASDAGGGSYNGILNNCTLIGNSAAGSGGGGAGYGTLNNSILYFNTALSGDSNFLSDSTVLNYCCTLPQPATGFGNITNAPLFINLAGGNLRLQSNSPCINAGNNANAPGGPDLDGNPRIVGGTVDIGAYEFQTPTSVISYAWLQQYGLPTNGSADYTDPDGDGLNNWQEWVCGTDPTNPLSALRLVSATPAGTNVIVTWQSVAGVTYFLEWRTNLSSSSSFMLLATNLTGQPDATSFTHTNSMRAPGLFYRVGVNAP